MPYIFSVAEEEDELVCSVHYDLAKKKVVYLLPYDNLIVSDANFRKFYSDPSFCGFILARISPAVLSACPDDVYTVEDTIIDRFIFIYGPDPCDWKLSEDIAVLLVAYIGFLPKCKCYNAESHGTKLFNESALLDDSHLEPQRVNETAWCYDEMHWHDERHWKYRSGEVTASVPEVLAICGELSLVGTKYRCVQLEDGYVCCCRSEGENACNGAKRFYAQFDETSMGSTTTPPDWEDELIFREEILHPNY
ncbi:hypothetical protein Tcan_15031 [Toxocara canis]|uniref:Uncharacterized protein n=1 Tax=Toxocara canis TaxID=6265 RepID=A0A0B2W112_TOXCA|nr:hypothetical protein Tcan_15031 [Toxocara canis]